MIRADTGGVCVAGSGEGWAGGAVECGDVAGDGRVVAQAGDTAKTSGAAVASLDRTGGKGGAGDDELIVVAVASVAAFSP
ncbi:hypothetical protein SSAG_00400 [Streptomyces sp. Mg1]|nr:hypothetical protein M444_02525 [Streptomyces sp. Mg1]EDX20609.1 hypothetical protein SSAG_00400 [Streptomyces sp. Mg1]